MKDLWRKHQKVSVGPRWNGPCGDSFCYASCDMPHCRRDLRLGVTPGEHNAIVATLHRDRAQEIIALYGLSGDLATKVTDLFEELEAYVEKTPELVRLAKLNERS